MKPTESSPEATEQNRFPSVRRRAVNRRRFLATASATALATTAGCLGILPGDGNGDENGDEESADRCEEDDVTVVLDEPPEDIIQLDDPPYPDYGKQIPEVTAPAPLHDREVSTTEFVCDRHQLYTFIFTRCHEACPALTSILRHVQADAIEEGYEDEVAFLQYTFDPEYDTPEVIAEYEEAHGVNPEPEHWYTLRPETQEQAKEIVHETFGQEYVKVEDEAHDDENHDDEDNGIGFDDIDGVGDEIGDQDGHDDENEHDHDDENEHDHDEHDHNGTMPFQHLSLVLLVNKAGYVERAYGYELPGYQQAIDDTRELVERW